MCTHLSQHAGSLRASHDGDARVGPGEQEVWAECTAAHAIVARTKAPPDDERDFGHLNVTHAPVSILAYCFSALAKAQLIK